MIDSSRYGRVLFLTSMLVVAAGVSACSTDRQASTAASRGQSSKIAAVRPAAKTAKPASAVQPVAVSKQADPVVTASTNSAAASASPRAGADMTATLIGKTWNYEYPGSRGTITYFPDQTSSYNEPGLRRGTGKWQLRGQELCQSFSGIKERCLPLRHAGNALYAGQLKLTLAEK